MLALITHMTEATMAGDSQATVAGDSQATVVDVAAEDSQWTAAADSQTTVTDVSVTRFPSLSLSLALAGRSWDNGYHITSQRPCRCLNMLGFHRHMIRSHR